MDIRRVALIYDDRERPETTGVYCRRALASLVEVVHFRPDAPAALPDRGFDLYLNIDDGLAYHLPAGLRPCAWWAIDTHLNFEWCREKAAGFDIVFAAQRDGAARLEAEGIAPASWLPLACDPELHRRHEVEKIHDIAFVGNIFPGSLAELIERLRQRFRATFAGLAYFEAMARIYSAARLVFNRSIRNDVNMRVFEAVACGSLLLTNDLADNGQAELFRDGEHLATYREADELLDKAAYYLEHEATRERIAAAGRAEAVARHTYRHRMQAVLERVERVLSGGRSIRQPPHPAFGHPLPTPRGEGNRSCTGPDPGYYEFARPELLALIPGTARRVLDVGCGAGRLGEALKARQPAEVLGVELVPAAAERARTRLDGVYVGDVEGWEPPTTAGRFDCVVCGDVIEHLREPGRFLRRARGWLDPRGRLVASLPNARHHTVVRSLLEGNWTYEPAGLLDETHLSFFTRRDMIALFERAGFRVEELRVVPGPGYDQLRRSGCPGEVRVGRLHIADLPPEEAEEFFVYQYLIVARPRDDLAVKTDRRALEQSSLGRVEPACPGLSRTTDHRPRTNLRIAFLGNFEQAWSTERYAADALECIGHAVHRIHEYGVAGAAGVLEQIEQFQADCLVFFKGRIGVDPADAAAVLRPDPGRLVEVLRRAPVPAYLWYFDRVHGYDAEPSRLEGMRRVAPLCRVAFVTDAGLAATDWANWRVLRQGISRPTVDMETVEVPERDREDLAFVGQLYGPRRDELEPIRREFRVNVISDVFGRALSTVLRRHRIVLGPRYPNAPGYWSDRVYVVLGHGGFFLAPEVEGMRDEGLEPGVHYAPLGDDPVREIRHWLARPEERARIAHQGQELVLDRFTYEDRARALGATIAATLDTTKGLERPQPRSHGRFARRTSLRFRHPRKLGDIIYALPVVRHLGGGILYLDPTSLDGTQDQDHWRRQFATLIPFLEQQPYLHAVRIHEGESFDVDLDAYLRTTHGTPGDRTAIAANHFIGLGLEVPDPIVPWLAADQLPVNHPIVVHRSPRYPGCVDHTFLQDVADGLYCVGSEEERRPFEAIGARPVLTEDVRALAAAIHSCHVFIGNQSLPLALAAGLGKPRMIEEDTRLPNVALGGPDEFILTGEAAANRAGLAKLRERAGCRTDSSVQTDRPAATPAG
jgi:2-polyprenyl-3-methyl-5-hydroxy-6-metoxy-1,4-benzoquinol methylase